MPKRKAPKQVSGGKRMIAAGKKPMNLGLQPEQHALFLRAAQAEAARLGYPIPMTAFVVRAAEDAAKKILENLPNGA